ncbi:MAG: sulfite exporter TauE/SafE family protein [Clostridia bacterium]|nr:sulfite exporter TauE/SafE family protein [Clostridia bacterium]
MIFTVIASFVIAVLSGMGVGGGGLFVVFLAMFTETPQLAAQGINLLFFLFSSGSAVCVHLSKRKIFGTAVLIMASFGIIGALAGTALSSIIKQTLLRKIFGVMLVISGILSLKQSFTQSKSPEEIK